MSDDYKKQPAFTNEDTIVRRAWIETALESVRGHLSAAHAEPDSIMRDAGLTGSPDAAETEAAESAPAAKPARRRSHLYVAWSSPARRSGT